MATIASVIDFSSNGMNWASLTDKPITSSYMIALLKATQERLGCWGLGLTPPGNPRQDQIAAALSTEIEYAFYNVEYARLVHRGIDELIPKTANHTDTGTWAGNADTNANNVFPWTEADLLSDIGDATRVPEPSRYSPVTAEWFIQSYQLLKRLLWRMDDVGWERKTASAKLRSVASSISQADAESLYTAASDTLLNTTDPPEAFSEYPGQYVLLRRSNGTIVDDPNDWCKDEGYDQEIDEYVYARAKPDFTGTDFNAQGDGYVEDQWQAESLVSSYSITSADWVGEGGQYELPIVADNQSTLPVWHTVTNTVYGYQLYQVVNIRKFNITNGLRFL